MENNIPEIEFGELDMDNMRDNRKKSLVIWASMLVATCAALLIFGNIGDAFSDGIYGLPLSPVFAALICFGLADAAFWFVLSLTPPTVIYEDAGERYHFALLTAVIIFDLFISAASGLGNFYSDLGSTVVLVFLTVAYFLWRFPSLSHMHRIELEIHRVRNEVDDSML